MRLLYLANARIPTPRAYGVQIVKTCEAFAQEGVEVTLVTPTRNVKSGSDPFSYYHVEKNFVHHEIKTPDFLALGPLGFLLSTLFFTERVRYTKMFRKADLLYSRDVLVLLQYLFLHRPYVFEAHVPPSFLSRIVATHARTLVVISQGLAHAYERAGVASQKITVARDAVDIEQFSQPLTKEEARKALALPQNASIALYAGHLYPRKGADVFAISASFMSDVLCVFVGGTTDDCQRFKTKYGTQKNIQILGHLPHEQIPLYLRAVDVLVLPNSGKDTDSALYTSPMKLFEYMASGTPIVASRVPALGEILTDEDAYFVIADDAKALAHTITQALQNTEEARTRAHHAKVKVASYTWTLRAKHILSAITP